MNDLLKTRIIAYAAGTAEASKSGFADYIMKEIIYENLGGVTFVPRDITPLGFSIAPDVDLGTVVTLSFSWEPMLDTLKKISDASQATPATAVYFGIVPLGTGWLCEFRTNIQQWGQDHRHPSGPAGPVIFSLSFRNLENVTRNVNYRDEVTFAYAGGQGDGALRNIQTDEDAIRVGASPFNRREVFVNANNSTTNASVMAEATAAVRAGRPRRLFSANLTQVGNRVYGRDYGHGDYVTCVFEGETIDARIDAVSVNVSGNNEDVQMLVREETTA
jgi:hypothetical protein